MSLDSLCRWQVQVSVYCAWQIPAHLRCTQCSILLHLMDICFLTCICLWQISQIQTFLFKVVGPGLVSTSPAFVSSSASYPAGSHGRHDQKNGKSGPHSLQTTLRAPKPTQDIEIAHHHNVNSKLAFHEVASFHQQHSTFTL